MAIFKQPEPLRRDGWGEERGISSDLMNNIINNILISRCYNIFTEAIQGRTFPGAAIGIVWGNPEQRKRIIATYGHTTYSREKEVDDATVYDLASLTKPLATTLAILALLKERRLQLVERVSEIFPQQENSSLAKFTIKDLLCHSAGFPAHQPYYIKLLDLAPEQRGEALLNLLAAEPLVYEPGSASIYSDLGFMLLGLIVEKKSGQDLACFFREKIAEPLGIADIIFYGRAGMEDKEGKGKKAYAPTEDCSLRERILYGEVSDENAYALGGVAGHAGLFGTIGGVLEMGVHLLDQWLGREEHPAYLASDLQNFLIRQEVPCSTWALGFDTPSAAGSTGGRYLAPTSVGHLGFTGTSLWIDPTRDLVMVLLSNRVHPCREKNRIRQFRPLFHETVMESLGLI
jgi:CubicO group peptidase (beta-lactamase class C family)